MQQGDFCPNDLFRKAVRGHCELSRNLRTCRSLFEAPAPFLLLRFFMRWRPILCRLSESSTATHFRPVFRAATAVVPPPRKGVRTVPFSGYISISCSSKATGIQRHSHLGCPPTDTSPKYFSSLGLATRDRAVVITLMEIITTPA